MKNRVLILSIVYCLFACSGEEVNNRFCNLPARLNVENVQQAPVLFTACESMGEYCYITSDGQRLLFTDATNHTSSINLTAIAFAAYFWLGFILARFESQVTNSKSLRLLAMVPALLVPVIHIIGFFTGQNVTFLPGGGMSYGICHLLITCIQLLYVLAATLFALHRYRHATTRQERRLSLVFMSFMVPFVLPVPPYCSSSELKTSAYTP